TGERLWIAGKLFRQKFEGGKSVKPRVLGLVHHTHATAAELLDDAVMRDDLVDHYWGLPGIESHHLTGAASVRQRMTGAARAPHFWIWRPSFGRQRYFNPPERRTAQRTLPACRTRKTRPLRSVLTAPALANKSRDEHHPSTFENSQCTIITFHPAP